jgi:hypothetical protein
MNIFWKHLTRVMATLRVEALPTSPFYNPYPIATSMASREVIEELHHQVAELSTRIDRQNPNPTPNLAATLSQSPNILLPSFFDRTDVDTGDLHLRGHSLSHHSTGWFPGRETANWLGIGLLSGRICHPIGSSCSPDYLRCHPYPQLPPHIWCLLTMDSGRFWWFRPPFHCSVQNC